MYLLQTGPKGVMKDFQRFKQLEREHREEQKDELAKLAKKFSITCRTNVSTRPLFSLYKQQHCMINYRQRMRKPSQKKTKWRKN